MWIVARFSPLLWMIVLDVWVSFLPQNQLQTCILLSGHCHKDPPSFRKAVISILPFVRVSTNRVRHLPIEEIDHFRYLLSNHRDRRRKCEVPFECKFVHCKWFLRGESPSQHSNSPGERDTCLNTFTSIAWRQFAAPPLANRRCNDPSFHKSWLPHYCW